jgi:hypothetical protein
MAQMHPPRFPYPREPMRSAEGRFFRACEEQLDDDWTVLYEQHWHGRRNGRNQMGEADFVMFHVKHGAFVVEVKGGQEIGVENGKWYTVAHGHSTQIEIKNPFRQVEESKILLRDWLNTNVPNFDLRGELGHLVVFPGHRQMGDISPQARRAFICDREDLQNLAQKMSQVSHYFSQGSRWSAANIRAAVSKLMPTFRLVGSKRVEYDDLADQLEQLTEFQLQAFAMLRNQSKLNVHGGAGTGKTVLAFHRAVELALDGMDVLFLCHSEPLARFLRVELESRTLGEANRIRIFSEQEFVLHIMQLVGPFMDEVIESAGNVLDESFLVAATKGLFQIDALIIDEAQSVTARIAEFARLFLHQNGMQYIFGDINQSTIRTGELLGHSERIEKDVSALVALGSNQPVQLNLNCRSSQEIAEFAHEIVQSGTGSLGSSFAKVMVVKGQPQDFGTAIAGLIRAWNHEYALTAEEVQILIPKSFFKAASLFNDAGFIDELGFSIDEEIVIDWVDASSAYAHRELDELLYVVSQSSKFHDDVPHLSDNAVERLEQFNEWHSDQLFQSDAIWVRPEEMTDEQIASYELQEEMSIERWKVRKSALQKSGKKVYSCKVYEEFIGLESQVVIAVLPFVSKGQVELNSIESFASSAYTMATRARALLAFVGEPASVSLLESLRNKLQLF